MAAEKKEKKKKKMGKSFFIFFISGVVIAFVALTIGYIYFEFSRLSYLNLDLKSDWRSYLAFISKKIPVLKDYVKYEYIEIGDPLYIQNKIVTTRINSIDQQIKEIDTKQANLEKILEEITNESSQLDIKRDEVQKLIDDYNMKIADYDDYNNRIEKLAEWLNQSTPAQIARALVRDEVTIDLMVDTLYRLSADISAEIIQAIADLNPEKAAKIISKLGEKKGGT